MEALRNYVQHRGLPVRKTSMPRTKIGEDNKYLRFSLSFMALKDVFLRDKGFKKSVLTEMPDEVDLWLASKKYIECVSKIQDQVRKLIKDDVNLSRQELDKALSDYQEATEETVYGVTVYELLDTGLPNKIPIFLEWDEVRKQNTFKFRSSIRFKPSHIRMKLANYQVAWAVPI